MHEDGMVGWPINTPQPSAVKSDNWRALEQRADFAGKLRYNRRPTCPKGSRHGILEHGRGKSRGVRGDRPTVLALLITAGFGQTACRGAEVLRLRQIRAAAPRLQR
jgi:hypothetical protein